MIIRRALAAVRLAAVWLVAVIGAPASAADSPGTSPAEAVAEEFLWHRELRLRGGVEGVGGVDYGDAEVFWLRAFGQAALSGPLSERWSGSVSLSADYEAPEFDGEALFIATGADAPFENLFESTFRIGARVKLRERWAFSAQPYLSAKLERGGEFAHALSGGTLFALEYAPSDRLDVIAGVKLGSRLDRTGLSAWPYLRVRWQIDDRIRVWLDNERLELEYTLRERIDVFAFARGRRDRYRLDARTEPPAGPGTGSISLVEVMGGFGLRWNVTGKMRLVGSVGALFWQRLTVSDGSAERFDERSTHQPAAFARLMLEQRF